MLHLESTNKAERVKENITVIPVSLKFLRIIDLTLFFLTLNRDTYHKTKPLPPITIYYLMPTQRPQRDPSKSPAGFKEG